MWARAVRQHRTYPCHYCFGYFCVFVKKWQTKWFAHSSWRLVFSYLLEYSVVTYYATNIYLYFGFVICVLRIFLVFCGIYFGQTKFHVIALTALLYFLEHICFGFGIYWQCEMWICWMVDLLQIKWYFCFDSLFHQHSQNWTKKNLFL